MAQYRTLRTSAMPVIQILYGELILITCMVFVGCDRDPVSSYSTREHHALHANHPGAQRITRDEFGLANMNVEILASEVQYQSVTFENHVSFEDASRVALVSFMEDGTDLESPLGLIKEDFGTPEEESQAILFNYLNRPRTCLRLVSAETDIGYPERRESIQENWLFCLRIGSLSGHLHWAIVDRSGKRPTYNYGFN